VARPQERKFLGFRFTGGRQLKRCIAPQALRQLKKRVRELWRASAAARGEAQGPPTDH